MSYDFIKMPQNMLHITLLFTNRWRKRKACWNQSRSFRLVKWRWYLSEEYHITWWDMGLWLWCQNKSTVSMMYGKIITKIKKSTLNLFKCEGDYHFYWNCKIHCLSHVVKPSIKSYLGYSLCIQVHFYWQDRNCSILWFTKFTIIKKILNLDRPMWSVWDESPFRLSYCGTDKLISLYKFYEQKDGTAPLLPVEVNLDTEHFKK